MVDGGVSIFSGWASGVTGSIVAGAVSGAITGSCAPVVGNIVGAGVGCLISVGIYFVTDVIEIDDKPIIDYAKDGVDWICDQVEEWFVFLIE